MKLIRCAMLFAATVCGSSFANAEAVVRTLDIQWLKDGQIVASGTSVLQGRGDRLSPFLTQTGGQVGYVVCTRQGNSQSLVSKEKFVGRLLSIMPVSDADGAISVDVTAIDNRLVGMRDVTVGSCESRLADTTGLDVSGIRVTLRDDAPVDVPLGDPHYQLRLSVSSR